MGSVQLALVYSSQQQIAAPKASYKHCNIQMQFLSTALM